MSEVTVTKKFRKQYSKYFHWPLSMAAQITLHNIHQNVTNNFTFTVRRNAIKYTFPADARNT